MLHMGASQARRVVDKEAKKVRQLMRSKRRRQGRVRKMLGRRKEQGLHQIRNTKAYEKEDKKEKPPWVA